ncbi:hypothetical protein JXC34_06395 [Candidatus Woesearchaeota archaeon]|nr:hypothetical protein [Candidatus Woesearchaeota archaeon]
MFVDVCFPADNENEFIKIAEKLGTEGLCFVYDDPKKTPELKSKNKLKLFSAIIAADPSKIKKKNRADLILSTDLSKIAKPQEVHYYYSPEKNEKKSFHFPSRITQVPMKEIASKNKMLGISFNMILKNPGNCEKLSFVLNLSEKYGVKAFVASFADNPYGLRSKKELHSVGTMVCGNTKLVSESLVNLSRYFC